MPDNSAHREEYANTLVAQGLRYLLGHRAGFSVQAETKGRRDRKLPDFDIASGGWRIVMEAKYNDTEGAAEAAQRRFQEMHPAPDIVGAIAYSHNFESDPEKAMRDGESIRFAFRAKEDARDWSSLWRHGTVYDLAQSLRRPQAIIRPQEDEVDIAANRIRGAIAIFADSFSDKPQAKRAIAELLQANFSGDKKRDDEILTQSVQVAGLILFGAFLFQFALADSDKSRVKSPTDWDGIGAKISDLRAHWQFILDEINYVAIFKIALQILLKGNVTISPAQRLIDAASDVQEAARDGSDLMGRVYHFLLADAKPLGAFYTSIPAATLMAGIALNPADLGENKKWADMNFIRKLRIADPACGSGTLLAAACWKLRDNFTRADFQLRGIHIDGKDKRQPIRELQRSLIEETIWGYDILETAAHLTATTLGMMSPEVDFKKAHIYRTIIGKTGNGPAAGSLELLEAAQPILFRRDDVQIETQKEADPLPPLDLCIMNPPFVRGTAGNESYSFLSGDEQVAVHSRMSDLAAKHNFVPDGQGPGFVALACKNIKPGGRFAVILPATFAVGMGKAWRDSREMIEKDFDLEVLIVSRENARPNFSENTNLQECICIARKRRKKDKPTEKAIFAVLHRNPRSGEDALGASQAIVRACESGKEIGNLNPDSDELHSEGIIGQFALLPYRGKSAWRGISFSNIHLAFAAENFAISGDLAPFIRKGKIPLRPLSELARLGSNRLHKYAGDPDHSKRRVRISKTTTPFPGYYPGYHKQKTGVSHKDIAAILEKPNCHLLPLPQRNDWGKKYFGDGGRIVLIESFAFDTSRRLASLISRPVQASHYWPIRLHKESAVKLKAMTLWLNSTPSIFLIAHAAASTYGAKVTFSQAAAKELPVLDLDSLSESQIKNLADAFDDVVRSEDLLPLPMMTRDKTREKIDSAIAQTLKTDDFRHLREALAAEPIIAGKSA